MSQRAIMSFASICNLQILQAGIQLLNQTKKTNMELVFNEKKTGIVGWNGANWADSQAHYHITNTGTAGTIGVLIFDENDKEIEPEKDGSFCGKTKLIGDHIYIDRALGRGGSQLHAACDAARHIMIAQAHQVPVTRCEYVPATNEYLVECEVG